MELNQNFPHIINSSFLSFYSNNIVLTSHVICHVTISLKNLIIDKLVASLKKKSKHNIFLIHVN